MTVVLNCQPGLANLESQEDNSGDYSDISDYSNSLPWVNLPHIHSRTDREGLVPEQTKGNKSKAAGILGISRRTLREKLKLVARTSEARPTDC